MIKINLHSFVDVITNSSSVIYTYQNKSLNVAKELLEEFLKLQNITTPINEIFKLDIFLEDETKYYEYYKDNDSINIPDELKECCLKQGDWYNNIEDYIKELKEQILDGITEKPNWMEVVENYCFNEYGSEDSNSIFLHIKAKDSKYDKYVELLIKFLNSSEEVEGNND